MISPVENQKHILIVDDEQTLSQTLSMLLETRGYEVKIAYNAREAYQLVSPEIDLIILDLILPDSNGFEICRKLKNNKLTRNIPIIVISAASSCEDRIESLYLGADDFLPKPCEHEELFARMEVVLRRGQATEQKSSLDESGNDVICQLRHILDQALLEPYFQPIYLLSSFQLYGLEVLTRPKTESPLANPAEFFKAALQYGMYPELELLSWSIALNEVKGKIREERIFLNCNPYLIQAIPFVRIKELVEKNLILPQQVVLEITERSPIKDFKSFFGKLYDFRSCGFSFAVDDVGGGYSSLEAIVETKPEVVKIDKHIVRGCSTDAFKQSIIKFIVILCRDNNVLSVAEGIENAEDLKAVQSFGVDAAQGYYLYVPTAKFNLDELKIPRHQK